jgi:hypothetical protein
MNLTADLSLRVSIHGMFEPGADHESLTHAVFGLASPKIVPLTKKRR